MQNLMKKFGLPRPGLILFGFVVSFFSLFNFTAVDNFINIPQDMFEEFINRSFKFEHQYYPSKYITAIVWAAIVSVFYAGALMGAFFAQFLVDFVGRKQTLFIYANLITIFGSAIGASAYWAQSFEQILLARVILGFSGGITLTVLPIYIAECSPDGHRGLLCSMQGSAVIIEGTIAVIISYPSLLGNHQNWPYLWIITGIPAALLIGIGFLYPESPTYVFLVKKDEILAKKIIKSIHQCDDVGALKVLANIQKEKEFMEGNKVTFRQIWSDKALRTGVLISAAVGVSYAMAGSETSNCYSTSMYLAMGFDINKGSLLTMVQNIALLLVTFFPMCLCDRWGRRPVFCWMSVVFLALFLCFDIGFIFTYHWPHPIGWLSWLNAIVYTLSGVVYYAGPGVVCWFISTEILPENCRAIGSSISIITLWIGNIVTTGLFPVMLEAIGPYTILILHIIPYTLLLIFIWIYLPETKQRSIADIVKDMHGCFQSSIDDDENNILEKEVNKVKSIDAIIETDVTKNSCSTSDGKHFNVFSLV